VKPPDTKAPTRESDSNPEGVELQSRGMSSYTQIYYHIVFSTKNRARTLSADGREELFRYIWGIVEKHGCRLYRIGGVEDHLHMLMSLHPTVALADLVKDVKVASSLWIAEQGGFQNFTHWQDGYAAFTHSHSEKNRLVEYIQGQAEHHKRVSFHDELKKLLVEAGVEFDERYLV
jgi:putative transposase